MQREYVRINCYFSKEEGEFIQKMADEESLKIGAFIKRILVSELKKIGEPAENPFCNKNLNKVSSLNKG